MSEKKLKELNESIRKDIENGKREIYFIFKFILVLFLLSMITVLITSLIRS